MPLVFLYSIPHLCNMQAYYKHAASVTGTKPHSWSLVREDSNDIGGKYWNLEPPRVGITSLLLHLLSWLLWANHLTLLSCTDDSLSAK